MPRSTTVQTNFTSGEISPRLYGRIDLNRYQNGAKRIENFIVKPQGGLFRRCGTLYCANSKTNQDVVLVEFEASEGVTFVLEFGSGYIRFYQFEQQVLNAGVPYELVAPYVGTEIQNLQFAQSVDVLYITNPSYQTRMLTYSGITNWALSIYETIDGPYLPENTSDVTMQLSNMTDVAFVESSANDFAAGDVGKYVEFNFEGNPVIALVTANVSPTRNQVTPLMNILAPLDPKTVLTYGAPNLTSTLAVFSNTNVGSFIKRATGNWHEITGFTSTTQVVLAAAVALVTTTGVISMVDRVITATCKASADVFNYLDVKRDMRFNFQGEQVWGKIATYVGLREVTLTLGRPIPLRAYDPRDTSPSLGDGSEPPKFTEPDLLYSRGGVSLV